MKYFPRSWFFLQLFVLLLISCSLEKKNTVLAESSSAKIKQLVGEAYQEVGWLKQNSLGNKVEYKYYQLHQKFFYNKANQLTKVTNLSDPNKIYDETLHTYDANGNLLKTQVFDVNGKSLSESNMKYNEVNQLTNKSTNSAFAAKEVIQYNYDEGQLTQEVRAREGDSKVTIKYLYDTSGHLQFEEFFEAGEIGLSYHHTYNGEGNRIETRKAEGVERALFMTITFIYDAKQQKIVQKCEPRTPQLCNADQYWEYNAQGFVMREYEKVDDVLMSDKYYIWE